jgi:hypothetical protein
MPPTLKTSKKEMKVYSVEGPVILLLSPEGIEFKAKGTKVGVSATWPEIVASCKTPENVPSKFNDRPLEFLKFQAQEQLKRTTKRLAEGIAKEIAKEGQ